jgi:hypothetical protein
MSGGTERLRGLVAKWREEAGRIGNTSKVKLAKYDTFWQCADELEAALADSPNVVTDARGTPRTQGTDSIESSILAGTAESIGSKGWAKCQAIPKGSGFEPPATSIPESAALAEMPPAVVEWPWVGTKDPMIQSLRSKIEALEVIVPSELTPKVQWIKNGPHISRDEVLSIMSTPDAVAMNDETPQQLQKAMPPAGQGAHGWNVEQILVYIWQCLAGEGTPEAEYPYERFRDSEIGKRVRVELGALAARREPSEGRKDGL